MAEALGGRSIDTAAGPCLVVDRRYEADRWHGDVRVGDCVIEDAAPLGLLDRLLPPPPPGPPDPSRVVFVDLETTGLSGGAGTVAFLVGCGFFDLGAFQVRQFLLTGFAAERALLAAVADFVGPATLIVTYNGKTFDLPVMETRWLFHRMETPFTAKRHFDMLHPARRLWRDRRVDDSSCSLGALERRLVGFQRTGDVPGFEIPSRYFQFLRTGDARLLEDVLEHNRLDLVSLAAVVARGLRLVEGGPAACRDARETLALGKLLEHAGRPERAGDCYRHAAARGRADVAAEALARLARALRRARRFDEAAAAWREVLRVKGRAPWLDAARREALEALAIHHEHRARDLAAARSFAMEAMEAIDAMGATSATGTGPSPRREAAVRHRIERLDRKLARVHEEGGPGAAPLLTDPKAGGSQA